MKKKKYLPVNTKPKVKKITTEVENQLPIEVIEQLELQAEALIYLIPLGNLIVVTLLESYTDLAINLVLDFKETALIFFLAVTTQLDTYN